jgi:signal transduction histidine kinase
MLSELLALVAHDLRNPLSALHSNLGFLAASPEIVGDARGALDDALVSCDALGQIIHNIGIVSHALSGAPAPQRSPIDPQHLAKEAVASSLGSAANHGATIELETSLASPRLVRANRDMALRALENLVENALQHGGSREPIIVRVLEEDKASTIVIDDGGIALSPEVSELAFTAKGQLHTKTRRGGRYGRGLGLYCAEVAARAAGGAVSGGERPDGVPGNRFTVRFAYA